MTRSKKTQAFGSEAQARIGHGEQGRTMDKVIVIVGQTASGKSDLAVMFAKKWGGEVISADSRQVYKGLDIGTNKITKKEMRGVPHHLLDIASPKKRFTVLEFKNLADKKIKNILSRGKIPVLCGGTGFYIDAVTRGIIMPAVPPNQRLRKSLEGKTAAELFSVLKKLDARRAKIIDKNNRVRLIRAIEIARALGKVPKITETPPPYKFIKIGLYLPNTELKQKLHKRTLRMFRQGLLPEIKKLKKAGITEKRLKELGFEYFHPIPDKVTGDNFKYAKRQMTWFKRDKEIRWFTPKKREEIFSFLQNAIHRGESTRKR
ncbi:MAG: tRNA (adenosine(37)-N6)-dimethylallyltransferase MiaA [bacterium]|nr:tRNA (adenosine(37)-N6)-dimethylallyltransferase MiaA [bacterium]